MFDAGVRAAQASSLHTTLLTTPSPPTTQATRLGSDLERNQGPCCGQPCMSPVVVTKLARHSASFCSPYYRSALHPHSLDPSPAHTRSCMRNRRPPSELAAVMEGVFSPISNKVMPRIAIPTDDAGQHIRPSGTLCHFALP